MAKKIERRLRLSSAPEWRGNPDLTSGKMTTVSQSGIDSSGNIYSGGPTGKRSNAKKERRQVLQVQGQKQPKMNQVLQPGDPQILEAETTTGQTGILYGVPQAPLVMVSDPSVINLYKKYFTTYDQYRRIRRDPTIALCRAVIAGPILSGSWSVKSKEGIDKDRVQFITDQLVKRRFNIMEKSVYGMIDYGWQGFEKVFETVQWTPPDDDPEPDEPPKPDMDPATGQPKIDPTTGGAKMKVPKPKPDPKPKKKRKMLGLRKVKPLLQDMTSIMVYLYTGDFAGFRQGIVFVEAPAKAVLMSFRVEGTMWHGYSLLEDARETVEKWTNAEVGAQRFDQKIAGSHFVVHYPMGSSDINGAKVGNDLIAAQLLSALEASGSIAVPRALQAMVEGMASADNENAQWKIEFLESKGVRQSTFVDREKYLDQLKCRAMRIPERAITEGTFGTKAEAEGHADIMTVILENLDFQITSEVNAQIVDQLLALNFGNDAVGTVWLESSPLSDDKIGYVRTVLTNMMTNQNGFASIFPHIDFNVLLDEVGVPKNKQIIKQGIGQQNGQLQPGVAGPGMPPGALGMPPAAAPGGIPNIQGQGMNPSQRAFVQRAGLKPGQAMPLHKLADALSQAGYGKGGKGGNNNLKNESTGPQDGNTAVTPNVPKKNGKPTKGGFSKKKKSAKSS